MIAKTVEQYDFLLFRKVFCETFCGKKMNSDCPEKCRIRKMEINTMGEYRLNELLEVKNEH